MFSRLYHSYNKSQLDLTLNCLESEFNSRFDSHLKKCPFDLLWSFRTEGNLQMSHRIRVQARTQLSMADDHHLKFLSGRHGPWNNDPATVCVHVLPLKKSHYWDPCPFTGRYPKRRDGWPASVLSLCLVNLQPIYPDQARIASSSSREGA